jgi:hypothetical protein
MNSAAMMPGTPSTNGCAKSSSLARANSWGFFARTGTNASSRASRAIPRTAATDPCRKRCRAGTICFSPRTSCRLNSSRSSSPKATDSALTGTNLRLILTNLGIKTVVCCGIFTDQCVSSTVRSLADESFGVVVVEDCCAAASDELHRKELEIINMIYCHVMSSAELKEIMGLGPKS